jgi:hypothetical protein
MTQEIPIYESRCIDGYRTEGLSVGHDETAPDRRQAEAAVKAVLRRKAAGYDAIIACSPEFEDMPGGDVLCLASGIAVMKK